MPVSVLEILELGSDFTPALGCFGGFGSQQGLGADTGAKLL